MPTAEQFRSIGGRIAPNLGGVDWTVCLLLAQMARHRPELDGGHKFQCLQIDGYQGDPLEAAASLSLAIAAG